MSGKREQETAALESVSYSLSVASGENLEKLKRDVLKLLVVSCQETGKGRGGGGKLAIAPKAISQLVIGNCQLAGNREQTRRKNWR